MIKNCEKYKYIYYFMLFTIGGVLFFLLGENGYILFSDSMNYLEPTEFLRERYIIYPLFLRIIKSVFGSKIYLSVVYWVQSALAFIVSWISTEYFRKRFNLSYFFSILIFCCLFLPYGYSLPENVATHHILTEGLAYTFFHFFLLQVIKCFLDSSEKSMIVALVSLILLVLLRSQLLFLVPVYFILSVCFIVKKRKAYQHFIDNKVKVIITLGISFIAINIAFIWLISSGKFLQATTAVSGRVLCLIESEDENLFEEIECEIYQELYDTVMESETNADAFRSGLRGWEDIANASNENTKIARNVVMTYYLENMSDRIDDGIDKIIASISGKLLQEHYFEYLGMTLVLCLESLVLSIFIQPDRLFDLCNILALGLYLISIFLFVSVKKRQEDLDICIPYLITMLTLIANVIITNMLFYGMQRYIVYTFGYFYLSLVLFVSKQKLRIKEA